MNPNEMKDYGTVRKTVKPEPKRDEYKGHSVGIRVKALEVEPNGDGTFTLRLPAYQVNPALLSGVIEVIPDLMAGFEQLLMKQALLNALDRSNF